MMINPSNIELAYFAGLLDGEGTFTIVVTKKRRNQRREWHRGKKRESIIGQLSPTITFAMKSKIMVEWAKKIFGGITFSRNVGDMYGWRLQKYEGLRTLIPLVLPYLKVKKQQAKVLLDYVNYRKKQEEQTGRYHAPYDDICISLAEKIRALNGNNNKIITLSLNGGSSL